MLSLFSLANILLGHASSTSQVCIGMAVFCTGSCEQELHDRYMLLPVSCFSALCMATPGHIIIVFIANHIPYNEIHFLTTSIYTILAALLYSQYRFSRTM